MRIKSDTSYTPRLQAAPQRGPRGPRVGWSAHHDALRPGSQEPRPPP